jgi:pilus assembly protein CpaB
MFLRIMAVLLGLVGISGIGLAFLLAQKPAPVQQVAVAPPPAPPPPAPKPRILAAGRPLRAGNLLVMEDISSVEVPIGQEPLGSYADTISARSALRGAMVRRSLAPNEPIVAGDVLNPGDRGFLAAVLGSGMRAVTVGVDPVSGTAGLIWPGDHVDVVLTQSIEEKDQPIDHRISGETVLTDVRVIAVDQQLVQGGQGAQANPTAVASANRTVTLEATTFDAERIAVASRLGRISLVVRSAADDQPSGGTEVPDTASIPPPAPPAIAWGGDVSPALRDHSGGKTASTIRVNHGKDLEEVHF